MAFSPAGISQTITGIVSALESTVPAVAAAAGVTNSNTVTSISTTLDDVKATVSALGDAEVHSQAQPLIERISADLSAVLATMAALPLPPQAAMAMRIAQMLIPVVMAAAQIVWHAA